MNYAMQIFETGGPDVFKYSEIPMPSPKAGEVLLRHTAIGLNFIDTYFRSGIYPIKSFPAILGAEAIGVIEAIGEGVTDCKIGDRVAYAGAQGGYCKYRTIQANILVNIPDFISDEVAAASTLKGLTAQYLLRRVFKVGKEHKIFFHAAAGGVGTIFGQWARHLGAYSIGSAGSDEKCAIAKNNGFEEVINYREKDFVAEALKINPDKFDVVYDGVGNDTFPHSLDIIKLAGLFVSFGQSSGPIPPFSIGLLNQKGSLYATRPSIAGHNPDKKTLNESAMEFYELVRDGIIKIDINQRFELKDIANAHASLQGRNTTGQSVIVL